MDVPAIEPILIGSQDLNQIIHHLSADSFLLIAKVLSLLSCTCGLETMLMDDCVDDKFISGMDFGRSTGADDQQSWEGKSGELHVE